MLESNKKVSFLLNLCLILICCLIFFSNCKKFQKNEKTKKHPLFYEISTRPWLFELSQKYGRTIKISNIPDSEFINLKRKGIDIIWMMGVWKTGLYGPIGTDTTFEKRKEYGKNFPNYQFDDIIGSPYSIQEYKISPSISISGDDNDLLKLKKKLNDLGILLCLDFVPNHTAVDSIDVINNSDLYVKNDPSINPPFDPTKFLPNGVYNPPGWLDTAQLNYWNPKTIQHQINILSKIAKYSDFIRCDMAYFVLNEKIEKSWGNVLNKRGYYKPSQEFWKIAINKIKSDHPNIKFLAEVYEGYEMALIDNGFDYVYAKTIYDRLTNGDLTQIHNHMNWLNNNRRFLSHSAHFVENHDEQRAVTQFGFPERAIAAALFTLTLPGIRFNHHGQWEGKRNKLLVQLRKSADEPIVKQVSDFYDKFIPLLSHSSNLIDGNWTLMDSPSNNLFVWKYTYYNYKKCLVVINYSDYEGKGSIVLKDAFGESGGDTVIVRDILNNQTYSRSAEKMRTEGLYVIVKKWWAQIFTY